MTSLVIVVNDLDTPNGMGLKVIDMVEGQNWDYQLALPSVDPLGELVSNSDGVIVAVEGSSSLSADWTSCPVPFLSHVWNGQLNYFGLGTNTFGSNSAVTSSLEIQADDLAEEITGMSGIITVTQDPVDGLRILNSTDLIETAIRLAHRSANQSQLVAFGIDEGGIQSDEIPAPAKRVQWIIRSPHMANLTPAGEALWVNLANWVFSPAMSVVTQPLSLGVSIPSPDVIRLIYSFPNQDILKATWTNETGGSANLWTRVSDSPPSDDTYVQTSTHGAPIVFKLQGVQQPTSTEHHRVAFRARRDGPGGVAATISLHQGYVDEENQGQVIDSFLNPVELSNTFQDYVLELGEAAVGGITDYQDLYVRIIPYEIL